MFAPVTCFIGFRYIHARRGHHFSAFVSATAIFATALGVTVLLTILSIMNGFESELRERILGLAAHLEVTMSSGDDPRAVVATIAALPGVRAAAPYLARDALVAQAGLVRAVEVRGVDVGAELRATSLASHLVAGSFTALASMPYGVVVGRELAAQLGLEVGSALTLLVPQPSMTPAGLVPRLKRFRVVAVFEYGLQEHDTALVLINRAAAARLFRVAGAADGVRVRLHDASAAPRMKHELADALGRARGQDDIRDWTDTHRNLFRAMHIEKSVMFIILALALAIAAFNVVSIMVVAVNEKTRDIAILAALGLRRARIMRVFLVQGGAIGLLGVALGLGAGILLAQHIDAVVAASERLLGFKVLSPELYYISTIPSELRYSDVIATALVALVLALGAPLYPAWLAARLDLAAGLRHE